MIAAAGTSAAARRLTTTIEVCTFLNVYSIILYTRIEEIYCYRYSVQQHFVMTVDLPPLEMYLSHEAYNIIV